jgi:hypothetical protein
MISARDRVKFLLSKSGPDSTIELAPDTLLELVEEIDRLRRVEVEFVAYRERMLAAAPYPFCRHPEKCIPTGRCKSDWVCND